MASASFAFASTASLALLACRAHPVSPGPDAAPAKIELRAPHGELVLTFDGTEKDALEVGPAGWKLADRYRITAPAPGYLDVLTPDGVPLLRASPDGAGGSGSRPGEVAHDAGGAPFLRASPDGRRVAVTSRDGTLLFTVFNCRSTLAALVLGDDAIDGDDRVNIARFVLHHRP